MSTLLEETTETITSTNDGDHERFAHYFRKADLDKAFFDAKPIKAICGKVDIPLRDFSKYPVCPTCQEIYAQLKDS